MNASMAFVREALPQQETIAGDESVVELLKQLDELSERPAEDAGRNLADRFDQVDNIRRIEATLDKVIALNPYQTVWLLC